MTTTRCEPHGNLILSPSEAWPGGSTDYCHSCWKAAGGVSKAKVKVASPVRKSARGTCLHLGVRTEFRPGCGGRMCRHECEAGEPVAVPGGVCQTCPKWERES